MKERGPKYWAKINLDFHIASSVVCSATHLTGSRHTHHFRRKTLVISDVRGSTLVLCIHCLDLTLRLRVLVNRQMGQQGKV